LPHLTTIACDFHTKITAILPQRASFFECLSTKGFLFCLSFHTGIPKLSVHNGIPVLFVIPQRDSYYYMSFHEGISICYLPFPKGNPSLSVFTRRDSYIICLYYLSFHKGIPIIICFPQKGFLY